MSRRLFEKAPSQTVHVHNHQPAKTHAEVRRDLWMQVAVSVARAEMCKDTGVPARWADKVLSDFDERFNNDH